VAVVHYTSLWIVVVRVAFDESKIRKRKGLPLDSKRPPIISAFGVCVAAVEGLRTIVHEIDICVCVSGFP
jgi:hypothetical protein